MRLDGFAEVARTRPQPGVEAWWAPTAARLAPFRNGPAFPAMAVAGRIVDWLDPALDEGESILRDDRPGVHYLDAAQAEVVSAAMVVGYLACDEHAAGWSDFVIADRSFRWAFGARPQWPWYAAEAAQRARDVRPVGVRGWAPWWRAAAIWPHAESIDLFAVACEYVWQHRDQLVLADHSGSRRATRELFDEHGWALRRTGELELPTLRLAEMLHTVVGADRAAWPWPYDTWPIDGATA